MKILLINSNTQISNNIIRTLKDHDFHVKVVTGFNQAFESLQSDDYQAVMCDQYLIKRDKLDLVKELQRAKINLPIIFFRSLSDDKNSYNVVRIETMDHTSNKEDYEALKRLISDSVKELEQNDTPNTRDGSKNQINIFEEQSLLGAFIVQDEKLCYVNKKFLNLFGYKNSEAVSSISFFELVAHISQKKVQQAFQDIRLGKVKSIQFGYTAIDKFRREIEVEVWLRKSEYNGKFAIEGIILDISERKEFHLKEKTYELRMMNEHKLASIGRLATGIAHNLNTPISVIMTNAELLQLKYIDSPELDKILRQAERMSSIINRLLTKSKQEQLQEPQALDLNKLISDELEFLNSNLEFKHNVQKEYFFDEHLPVIYAVYSDFSQSIMNIIQNAIDAMYKRPMKKLTVTTEYKNGNITITVKDTGVGIDEKNYLKLFDPFYTTKPSPHERKDDAPTGTGLGLATVHNLLTPYGVEIDVDSILDIGTTFTLRVPVDKVKNGNITR